MTVPAQEKGHSTVGDEQSQLAASGQHRIDSAKKIRDFLAPVGELIQTVSSAAYAANSDMELHGIWPHQHRPEELSWDPEDVAQVRAVLEGLVTQLPPSEQVPQAQAS